MPSTKPAPQAPTLTHDEVCAAIAVLEAKVQFLMNAQFFESRAAARDVDDLRAAVVATPKREWLTVAEAAIEIGRTPQAVRARCRDRKIGVKVKGVWQIDRAKLSQN